MDTTVSLILMLLVTAAGIIAAALITYFIVSGRRVSRSNHENLQKEYNSSLTSLEMERANAARLQEDHRRIGEKLEDESRRTHQQEGEIIALKSEHRNTVANLEQEREVNRKQEETLSKLGEEIRELRDRLATLSADKKAMGDKLETQKEEIEELHKRSLLEFTNVANKLLEEKSHRFTKMNQENIRQILDPLGENLKDFKRKVEETYDKESKQRFSLKEKINELVELNQQISKDATNLTRALTGQSKTQGDWGEMILENILEYSGLVRDREYFVQGTFRDEHGNLKKPDIQIKYPDDRYVMIDSKVSLTAYERYSSAEDPDEQQMQLVEHIRSIRKHIDDLSGKEYDRFDKSLDFVMLFVPIEPAYLAAIQYDKDLWAYAYSKRILLISPTNLIAALKMVADIWKREYQNKNAMEIAKRGERLYEKFVGFVDDMENIDKYLKKTEESWDKAMNKLSSGRGNLIGQAEKLRKLGLNPSKHVPAKFLEDGNEDDTDPSPPEAKSDS